MLSLIKKHFLWLFGGAGFAGIQLFIYALKNKDSFLIAASLITVILFFSFILAYFIIDFLKKRHFKSFCAAKIREFTHYLLNDKQTVADINYKLDCYEIHDFTRNLAQLLKETVCLNQGMIVNYHYNGGRLHKEVRLEQDKKEDACKEKLKEDSDKLKKFLYDKLIEAITLNVKLFRQYFSSRGKTPPRIIVKAFSAINNNIEDIYRMRYEYYTAYPVDANTGFFHVHKHGTYFLCNDIPSAAARDNYLNPRLISSKVREYLKYRKHLKIENNPDDKDLDQKKWIDCWMTNEYPDSTIVPPSAESCYRSTLIIPLTLLNNERLSEEFKDHFKIPKLNSLPKVGPNESEEKARAVYSFLCLDHQEENYFKDPLDINIGYIFADLISLYYVENLNYTEYSKTLQNITQKLN